MTDFLSLKSLFIDETHRSRRDPIRKEMESLILSGKNCFSCVGHCCTFLYNSMQVTPLEALDVYTYLHFENRINKDLVDLLKLCVKTYRLDVEISLGRKGNLRKNYTCPFFIQGPRGCSISPSYKPYGCLGFNPMEKDVSEEGKCTSYTIVLEQREKIFFESEKSMNENLKENLNIYWDKENLPVALLYLIDKLWE